LNDILFDIKEILLNEFTFYSIIQSNSGAKKKDKGQNVSSIIKSFFNENFDKDRKPKEDRSGSTSSDIYREVIIKTKLQQADS
jgi:hypothetical protein